MDWYTMFNSSYAGLAGLIGGIISVGFAIKYWTKASKEQRVEEDTTEDRIKTLLKERMTLQDDKIMRLTDEVVGYRREIEELKVSLKRISDENTNYVDIFRGRDLDSIEYRKEGREAMKVIRENLRQTNKVLEHMDKIYSLFEKCLKVTEADKLLIKNK